jgi:hypothetical protein
MRNARREQFGSAMSPRADKKTSRAPGAPDLGEDGGEAAPEGACLYQGASSENPERA